MGQSILDWFVAFFTTYGYRGVLILLVIGLTELLKWPIKKAAERYAEKTGYDKSIVTWVIAIIPFILTFVWVLLIELYVLSWNIDAVAWKEVAENTAAYGGAAVATFEIFKKIMQAFRAKKSVVASTEAPAVTEAPAANPNVVQLVPDQNAAKKPASIPKSKADTKKRL